MALGTFYYNSMLRQVHWGKKGKNKWQVNIPMNILQTILNKILANKFNKISRKKPTFILTN